MNRQEVFDWCRQRYGTEPDYPWNDWNAVLRHTDNKWYGIIIEVSGNFKEEYITGIKGEIEALSMTYRDLYGKCSEYLEKLGNSALEANLLKGIGNASNAVGKLIGSIPKIKDGQVDEFQQDSGERLKNNAVGMERNVVKAFAEISAYAARRNHLDRRN